MDVAEEDMALSTGFVWPRLGTVPPCREHGNRKPLGSTTGGGFLEQITDCQLLKAISAQSS
jgi:hypothetical protein